MYEKFEEVRANEAIFDAAGRLREIQGTAYDFKGKATFSEEAWASPAGVRTLCIRPRFTRPDDTKVWTYARRWFADLREILEYIRS